MSDFKIDDKTRLDFNKMLKESGASDNTEKIRQLKHSDKIREQVTLMMEIIPIQIGQWELDMFGKEGMP